MTEVDTTKWQAFLADRCADIVTDPDEVAELFADKDPKGKIIICRGTALPDETGHLSGSYNSSDIFVEIELEDIDELERIPETWQWAQRAAWGMNQHPKTVRRVWFVGDPEPEVGARVLAAGSVWVRHHQLRWILWPGGNGCPGLEWHRLIGDDRFPLVEVLPHEEVEKYGRLKLARAVNSKAEETAA